MNKRLFFWGIMFSVIHLVLVLISVLAVGKALSTPGDPNPQPTPVSDFLANFGEKILWLPLMGQWTADIRNSHILIEFVFLFLNSLFWGFAVALTLGVLTRYSHRLLNRHS